MHTFSLIEFTRIKEKEEEGSIHMVILIVDCCIYELYKGGIPTALYPPFQDPK